MDSHAHESGIDSDADFSSATGSMAGEPVPEEPENHDFWLHAGSALPRTGRRRVIQALTRRVRRFRRRTGIGTRIGREPVSIDALISPLRYDILVRQRYFDFLQQHEAVAADNLGELVELSRSHEYFAWFTKVDVPKFRPYLLDDVDLLAGAFAQRVRKSVHLYRSFQRLGYDRRRPITLFAGRQIEPTRTGKLVARDLYAGDGCHRLALLRSRGVNELEAGTYRILRVWRLAPNDNTALLLSALGVDTEAYWDFMRLAYGGLVDRARSASPDALRPPEKQRLEELLRVADVDRPLLAGPPKGHE